MEKKTFKGSIALDKNGITYVVSALFYTVYKDESFEYEFIPNYFVIDLLDSSVFQGIPGLNLDERRANYTRRNLVPTFISERVPQKNREDFWELLKEVEMDHMNPINYLLKTNKRYGGDLLFLIPYKEKELVDIDKISSTNNTFGITKTILNNLAIGNNVLYNGVFIDDTNRKAIFNLLIGLYNKTSNDRKFNMQKGINEAKRNKKYKGRKLVNVDMLLFEEYSKQAEEGKITAIEAAKKIGISIDKYYRVKKAKKL